MRWRKALLRKRQMNPLRTGERLTDWTAAIGWRLPFANLLSPRDPVVLMYHGIPPHAEGSWLDAESFEDHIRFLKRNFDIVSPNQIGIRRRRGSRVCACLTFDDGLRNNAEVVAPILRRHGIPALFFVSSRHARTGHYLWFTYLRMLAQHFNGNGFRFRGRFMDMSPLQRKLTMARLASFLLDMKPHPAAMYQAIEEELPSLGDFVSPSEINDHGAGMTIEQVAELSSQGLFHFGVHTVDHPLLTKCEEAEALHQILDNKIWLEQATNHPCDVIAYPMQDYDARIVQLCKGLGFRRGYAVTRSLNLDPAFELRRVGVYRKSMDRLGFKMRWASILN
jgi:peptidoglycan/xylan/chitin deacetylase (PgdA/CDA1 family)